VRVGPVGRLLGDDADLIQGEPALPHPGCAPGKLLDPLRDGGDGFGIAR
jgi:hypothetical protein